MEHRATLRLRRLKEGRIIFNAKSCVMNCQVRDVSDTGLRIRIPEPYRVPDVFFVSIAGKPARAVRKVWIGADEMGAAFT